MAEHAPWGCAKLLEVGQVPWWPRVTEGVWLWPVGEKFPAPWEPSETWADKSSVAAAA